MRLWLPKSMTGWVIGASVLVALPLLTALLVVDRALRAVSSDTHQSLGNNLELVYLGADLRDSLVQLERNARDYAQLDDPTLRTLFERRLQEVRARVDHLERHPARSELQPQLTALHQGLDRVEDRWQRYLEVSAPPGEVVASLRALAAQAEPVIDLGRRSAQAQLDRARRSTLHARRTLVAVASVLLPLTALFVVSVSMAVTRPLRRMAQGVEALGHGQYDEPIVVRFPAETQRLAKRLDWLRRRLGTLEADKDQFLRNVSHELKTPLASLREGAALLREGSLGKLTPEQKEVAQILTDAASELEALIVNLLTYAEWRNHRRRIDPEWFEARSLVEEVLNAHRLPLAKRQLRTELQLSSGRLFGQRAQLRVALDNLVTNAIKHAPSGSAIQIQAALRNGCCELGVRDEGRGVPETEKERIFEPFVRGAETEEFGVRGTGVGLSIVRETALAHGGTVKVEDAGPGARFRMQWPVPHA